MKSTKVKVRNTILIIVLVLLLVVTPTIIYKGIGYYFSKRFYWNAGYDTVKLDDASEDLIYLGNRYIADEYRMLRVDVSESELEDELVKLKSKKRFAYNNTYFSNTETDPLLIYEKRLRRVYFRADFDFMNSPFVFKGVDEELFLSKILLDTTVKESYCKKYNEFSLRLYSVQCPKFVADLNVFSSDGGWYAWTHGLYGSRTFALSTDFVNFLQKNAFVV